MRPAVALAQGHGNLRHGCLPVGIEELGSVRDDAAVLLLGPAEEAGNIDERHERDVERITEADKARGLARGVDVEHAGEYLRLVRHDSDGLAAHVRETYDYVLRPALVDFEELSVIDD